MTVDRNSAGRLIGPALTVVVADAPAVAVLLLPLLLILFVIVVFVPAARCDARAFGARAEARDEQLYVALRGRRGACACARVHAQQHIVRHRDVLERGRVLGRGCVHLAHEQPQQATQKFALEREDAVVQLAHRGARARGAAPRVRLRTQQRGREAREPLEPLGVRRLRGREAQRAVREGVALHEGDVELMQ